MLAPPSTAMKLAQNISGQTGSVLYAPISVKPALNEAAKFGGDVCNLITERAGWRPTKPSVRLVGAIKSGKEEKNLNPEWTDRHYL